ncbi:DUF2135 domain-containing protein [Iodobacter sp. CM08]|uniref:YfaP family protein n=1 Tax=Iodobacter sp. CM08 TaxID=3085902 RepID=UPI0029817551|nr:DUF2135 domain-containing protein [Iodobacter sp. CM08]MDW5415720.1 DUF2135 domain-containing protein [Iodobacter sp. CM08]
MKYLLILLLIPLAQAEGLRLDSPAGGWRNTTGKAERYTQNVQYPATLVNTPENQGKLALIRGHIGKTPKTPAKGEENKPYRLIVNGVPMPLRIDEDGSFSRPYSFSRGANSVEVRSPDGKERAASQFYDSNKERAQTKLRVVLSWNTNSTDLDLHVISPDGEHTYYGHRVSKNGGALDVDVTSGYGPEIYANPSPPKGRYLVYVNYYGGYSAPPAMTIAQLSIINNENTLHEKQQLFNVPMRKTGDLTLVGSFVYP